MIMASVGGLHQRRMYHISSRSWFALDIPQGQVFEDLFHELFILDERDNTHRSLALRAQQGINIIDFLYQARPVLTEFFG